MHNTTQRKKPLAEGFTISTKRLELGNLFPIRVQIAQAAMADKRGTRRKMKSASKARNWKED
jgi:hypothetical protein